MSKKTIGIKAQGYPERRNFTGLELSDYQHVKKWDLFRVLAGLYFKLTKKPHKKWQHQFYDLDMGKYEGLHFFNAISKGTKPWVTTFENHLPRGAHEIGKFQSEKKYIESSIGRLQNDACKQLIALSEYAKQSQINYLKPIQKAIAAKIVGKIKVIHPPQPLLLQGISQKPNNAVPKMTIVGADFFRKGGLEVLEVTSKLLDENKLFELNIVSSMQFGDYASKSTKADLDKAIAIIKKYPNHIKHFNYLENKKVMELFIASDIALLPSYGETYGYTVLEAQASGCAVVTTNGAAFPEINNNDCGWLIEVPIYNGRSVPIDVTSKTLFKEIVERELKRIFLEVIDNPNICKIKGQKALERIKRAHNPEDKKKELENIYAKF